MSASDFVTLRGGLTVPVAAVQLMLTLESRGLHLHADGDYITVGPSALLVDEDRVLLRRWKPHLLALLAYDGDQVQ